MWTAIAYRLVKENETVLPLYNDETEKVFASQDDANLYAAYLLECGEEYVSVYEKTVIPTGTFDINTLRKANAISKLTPTEITLLGIDTSN